MKKVCLILTFLFVSFLFSILSKIPLYGQDYQSFRTELDYVIENTKLRIGPFRILPTIDLSIGYDNNVYYQHKDNSPVSDYTVTFSPHIKVYLLFRNKMIFSIDGNPEYLYYYELESERRWNNNLSTELKILFLNRLVVSGGYTYWDRRWRATSEFDARASEIRENYKGSLFFETARRTSFGISASLDNISYEDITLPGEEFYLSRDLNRKERSGYFELYYGVFSESFLFVRGGYSEYEFEYPQSRWRDSYSYQVFSGIRFPLLGKVRGTFSLGYKKLEPKGEEKLGFSGLVGNTSLSFRIERFWFRFQYTRDVPFSYWTNSIFYIENRFGSGISFYLTRFLRLDYNFVYGTANYPEETLIQMPDGQYEEIKRRDIYRSHAAGFVIRIVKQTGIGVMINFWERESNYYWANRNRISVGGYITYEF